MLVTPGSTTPRIRPGAPTARTARRVTAAFAVPLLAAALAVAGCRRDESPPGPEGTAGERLPRTARWEVADVLARNAAAPRHPSDGGGRAWIAAAPDPHGHGAAPAAAAGASRRTVTTGTVDRFHLVFEVGPEGIAEGGTITFNPSPFWGWSPPQTSAPDAYGYTDVTAPEGVRLEAAASPKPNLLALTVRGRALRAGEQVRLVYGAGPRRSVVDRFAERDERFWFWVDGDGDGHRQPVADSPFVDVAPSGPTRLLLFLPSTARPGETVRLTAARLDTRGNAGHAEAAELRLEGVPPGLAAPATIALAAEDRGRRTVSVQVREPGVYRMRAVAPDGTEAESNPMVVREDAPRVLWADLHGHTNWSDGTGVPEDYFTYARDVAALDVVALTDHDHWGTPFLDESPERWATIRALTERFHAPGRFVTLLGFEWTSWVYGHRHVLYFRSDARGELLSHADPRHDTPAELWAALRGRDAMTFAHHSAGGPVATDWSFAPDPELEPLTEIVSAHGSSEAPDSPIPIYDPVDGNWVRDQLDRGYRLGFVGSGDSHDGHPGLVQFSSPTGGLAAIFAEPTRESVAAALRARSCYATNGARIFLAVTLGPHRMGETVSLRGLTAALPAGAEGPELAVRAAAPGPIARVDVVHAGRVATSAPGEGRRELALRWVAPPLAPGEYLYVRVVQEDRGAAWSSPFFVVE